ncbi:MAG: hypothetical protein QGI80_00250 [archaeon]|jgi:hypothetical protein|nr:hypothetical protein [archaeon]
MALLKKKKNDYDPLEDAPPEKDKLKAKTAGADIENIKEEVGFPNSPTEEAPLEPMPPAPPVPPAPEAPEAPLEAPPSETGQIPELIQPAPAGQPVQSQEEDPLAFLEGAGVEVPAASEDTSSQALPTPPSELPQANLPQPEVLEAPGVQEELPMAPAVSSTPAYDNMVMNETDTIRREFETKLSLLKDEIKALKKLDEEIKVVVDSMDRIEQKYEKVEIRAEDNNTKLTETLDDVKSTVSAIDKIMSSALPALIKEVRSISEIKSKGK